MLHFAGLLHLTWSSKSSLELLSEDSDAIGIRYAYLVEVRVLPSDGMLYSQCVHVVNHLMSSG